MCPFAEELILILDDLSKILTADTESMETTLKFLDHLITTASKKRCKVRDFISFLFINDL